MLTVSKQVRLKNIRLNVLYALLVAGTMAGYSVYFVKARKFVKPVDISQRMSITVEPVVWDETTMMRNMDTAFKKTAPKVCGTNVSQCMTLCRHRGAGNCRERLDLVQFEDSHTMFLATNLLESDSPRQHPYYLPYVDAASADVFAMNVEYGFEEPDTNFFTNQIAYNGYQHSSITNIQTVLLKGAAIWRTIQPDASPRF